MVFLFRFAMQDEKQNARTSNVTIEETQRMLTRFLSEDMASFCNSQTGTYGRAPSIRTVTDHVSGLKLDDFGAWLKSQGIPASSVSQYTSKAQAKEPNQLSGYANFYGVSRSDAKEMFSRVKDSWRNLMLLTRFGGINGNENRISETGGAQLKPMVELMKMLHDWKPLEAGKAQAKKEQDILAFIKKNNLAADIIMMGGKLSKDESVRAAACQADELPASGAHEFIALLYNSLATVDDFSRNAKGYVKGYAFSPYTVATEFFDPQQDAQSATSNLLHYEQHIRLYAPDWVAPADRIITQGLITLALDIARIAEAQNINEADIRGMCSFVSVYKTDEKDETGKLTGKRIWRVKVDDADCEPQYKSDNAGAAGISANGVGMMIAKHYSLSEIDFKNMIKDPRTLKHVANMKGANGYLFPELRASLPSEYADKDLDDEFMKSKAGKSFASFAGGKLNLWWAVEKRATEEGSKATSWLNDSLAVSTMRLIHQFVIMNAAEAIDDPDGYRKKKDANGRTNPFNWSSPDGLRQIGAVLSGKIFAAGSASNEPPALESLARSGWYSDMIAANRDFDTNLTYYGYKNSAPLNLESDPAYANISKYVADPVAYLSLFYPKRAGDGVKVDKSYDTFAQRAWGYAKKRWEADHPGQAYEQGRMYGEYGTYYTKEFERSLFAALPQKNPDGTWNGSGSLLKVEYETAGQDADGNPIKKELFYLPEDRQSHDAWIKEIGARKRTDKSEMPDNVFTIYLNEVDVRYTGTGSSAPTSISAHVDQLKEAYPAGDKTELMVSASINQAGKDPYEILGKTMPEISQNDETLVTVEWALYSPYDKQDPGKRIRLVTDYDANGQYDDGYAKYRTPLDLTDLPATTYAHEEVTGVKPMHDQGKQGAGKVAQSFETTVNLSEIDRYVAYTRLIMKKRDGTFEISAGDELPERISVEMQGDGKVPGLNAGTGVDVMTTQEQRLMVRVFKPEGVVWDGINFGQKISLRLKRKAHLSSEVTQKTVTVTGPDGKTPITIENAIVLQNPLTGTGSKGVFTVQIGNAPVDKDVWWKMVYENVVKDKNGKYVPDGTYTLAKEIPCSNLPVAFLGIGPKGMTATPVAETESAPAEKYDFIDKNGNKFNISQQFEIVGTEKTGDENALEVVNVGRTINPDGDQVVTRSLKKGDELVATARYRYNPVDGVDVEKDGKVYKVYDPVLEGVYFVKDENSRDFFSRLVNEGDEKYLFRTNKTRAVKLNKMGHIDEDSALDVPYSGSAYFCCRLDEKVCKETNNALYRYLTTSTKWDVSGEKRKGVVFDTREAEGSTYEQPRLILSMKVGNESLDVYKASRIGGKWELEPLVEFKDARLINDFKKFLQEMGILRKDEPKSTGYIDYYDGFDDLVPKKTRHWGFG